MPYATDYNIDTVKSGGRIVVSGDVTVAEKIIPDPALATLWIDPTHGIPGAAAGSALWEVVMSKGTIVTFTYSDASGTTFATICNDSSGHTPQGVLVQDAFRPFEKGDQAGISFVTGGYIELPMIQGTNGDLRPGDYVKCDNAGKFVKDASGNSAKSIGVVKFVELFEADDGNPTGSFDFGMLQYMQLPSDEFNRLLLEKALEAQVPGADVNANGAIFGVRGNLDVSGVVGAVRINLFNM